MDWNVIQKTVLRTCLSTFGQTIEYRPIDLDAVFITAIFESSFQSVDPNTGVAVMSRQPRLTYDPADLPRDARGGDQVLVGNKTYSVTEFMEEGEAGAIVLLQLV